MRNGSITDYDIIILESPRAEGDLGTLGPYRIQSVVGRGGTSIVFRAIDPDRRDVAIKVLRSEFNDRRGRADSCAARDRRLPSEASTSLRSLLSKIHPKECRTS